MFDLPLRLVIAYGLIAVICLAAALVVWRIFYNSARRTLLRDRAREAERYRQRDALAAAARATDIGPKA